MKRTLFFFLILAMGKFSFSQTADSLALANADTTHFQSARSANWLMYNSHVHLDSAGQVSFLAIVRHSRTGITWNEFQQIGTLKSPEMRPVVARLVDVMLLTDHYQVRVDPDGRVFLKLFSGQLPLGDPIVLPLEFTFSIQ